MLILYQDALTNSTNYYIFNIYSEAGLSRAATGPIKIAQRKAEHL